MATITISYSNLQHAVSETNKLASSISNYSGQIQSTVINKLHNLPGSDDRGYISAAESEAQRKIDELSKKRDSALNFKKDLEAFITSARDADNDVAKEIKTIGNATVGKRSGWQKVGDWLYNTFCVDLINANPVVQAISNVVKGVWRKVGSVIEDVHIWFKYKGGKYVWNTIKVVVGAIAAGAALIVSIATAGTALAVAAAVASAVVFVIALVNGAVSIYNNRKASALYKEGKLGQARYYGSIESVSDAVGKYDMGDSKTNNAWKWTGNTIDAVDSICKVIIAINGIANIGGITDPETGKITGYSWEQAKENIKKAFGFKTQRYSIDKKSGKAIKYNGEKSGYKVGDRWSLKNMFNSRKDGPDKQYIRKYLGFGSTDSAFYNKNIISGMSRNPDNTIQHVAKLYSKLNPLSKVSKAILDTGSVIDGTISKIESVSKIKQGVDTIFNSNESAWEKAKSGISVIKKISSNAGFLKPFKTLGTITGFFAEGTNSIDVVMQFAN